MRKLAVIGANVISVPFYKRAKELGFTVYGFGLEHDAVCKVYCDEFFPVSFRDKESILNKCIEKKIDGITSFLLESAVPTVVYVANKMGLETNSLESLELLKDKFTMRNCLRSYQVGIPEYHLIDINRAGEAVQFIEKYPLIVKPVDNGGKRGVSLVYKKEDLKDAIEYGFSFSPVKKLLIEQYIEGREFSVEYITCNGKHYFVALTDKTTSGPPHFVELEHHQPANVPDEDTSRIKEIVEKALTALEYRSGASHTEVKMDVTGNLYIIEVGPRMGGDYIASDLVELSTGYDFIKGVIDLSIGNFEPPVINKKKYAGIYFLDKHVSKVRDYISGADKYKEIVYSEDDHEELKDSGINSDRNGFFIYQSDKKFEI